MEDSLISIIPQIIHNALNTSTTEGNGYGLALGVITFLLFASLGTNAYQYRQKEKQTRGYIQRLEKLQDAHRRELNRRDRERSDGK